MWLLYYCNMTKSTSCFSFSLFVTLSCMTGLSFVIYIFLATILRFPVWIVLDKGELFCAVFDASLTDSSLSSISSNLLEYSSSMSWTLSSSLDPSLFKIELSFCELRVASRTCGGKNTYLPNTTILLQT